MGWGAEGSAFAVTGALFLVCGAIAGSSIVRVRRSALLSLLAVAAVFISAAILARSFGGWASSPWTWSVALLPIMLIALFSARASARLSEAHAVARCFAPQLAAKRRATSVSEAAVAAASSRSHRASDPASSGTELADLAYAHPDLRVAIAANPATPANVLGWLASIGGDGIGDAIARRGSENSPRNIADRTGSTSDSGA